MITNENSVDVAFSGVAGVGWGRGPHDPTLEKSQGQIKKLKEQSVDYLFNNTS